ncbi:MAG: LpqB family beta-propeller domain-containing protein [Terriglobales bacterium]
MGLQAGTKLGPYEVVSAAGAGGMGEVYRARDTRLERTVAIKVLPEQFSADPALKQRFEREARAISSLSHPHICHLYDVGSQNGTDYLVMEYLEGETLSERLAKGPLPGDQLLKVGIEVADALDKAHRQGVVHRDLKPGNIMLTKSGAKLMDFGLAKTAASALGVAVSASGSPLTPSSPTNPIAALSTKASPLTQKGMIVGTFQYMAPEVLQGAEADARSDIFSFGCVLYEMATGKRAFEGKTQLSVLAAILEKEPEPMTMQPMTPPALEMVVRSCLEKDPQERLQTAHDLKLQLGWTSLSSGAVAQISHPGKSGWRGVPAIPWALAAIAVLLAIAFGMQVWRRPALKPIHAAILPPEKMTFEALGDFGGPAVVSPDGEKIAFVAKGPSSAKAIWVRPLGGSIAQRLEGTDDATFPFWSADSHYLGYFSNGKLNKIPAAGGAATSLAPAPNARGGTWSKDDVIVYTPDFNAALLRVSAQGGTPQAVTKIDPAVHTTHRWPWFLPDGQHFLYLATNHSGGQRDKNGIYFASLDGKENKLLIATDAGAEYANGYLLFHSQTALMAQPFDPQNGVTKGDAVPVADRVQFDDTVWRTVFSVSANGVMVFQTGGTDIGTQLVWLDRSGKRLGQASDRALVMDARISPDGTRIAAGYGTNSPEIWIFDTTRSVKTRLTFDASTKFQPAWSPDGETIAYVANGVAGSAGDRLLCLVPANGGGKPQALVQQSQLTPAYPSWSADGKNVLYIAQLTPTGNSIYSVPVDGHAKPALVISPSSPQANISYFRPSPDGRWIAYVSNESGQIQVYVTSASGQGGKWQISTSGGVYVSWRGDGKELFYGFQDTIYSVEVSEKNGSFVVGQEHQLFHQDGTPNGSSFDVTRDGKKFLYNMGSQDASAPLNLVVNWTAEMKK